MHASAAALNGPFAIQTGQTFDRQLKVPEFIISYSLRSFQLTQFGDKLSH